MLFTWSLPLSLLQAGRGQPDVHQIQGGVWEALHETLHQQPPVCIHPAEPEAGRGGSAQRDCHSLPLWVSLPCTHRELPCKVPALPRLGSAALGRTGTTDAVCFHCQRDNLFWWLAWRMSGAGFSSHWINSWVYHTDKAASSMGRDSSMVWHKHQGLESRSSCTARGHRNHPSRSLDVCTHWITIHPRAPSCVSLRVDSSVVLSLPSPCTAEGTEKAFLPLNIPSDHVHVTMYTLCPRPNCWFNLP